MQELRQQWPKAYAEVRRTWKPLQQAIVRGGKDDENAEQDRSKAGSDKALAQTPKTEAPARRRLSVLARLLRRRGQ
jgi:hypothetical protein